MTVMNALGLFKDADLIPLPDCDWEIAPSWKVEVVERATRKSQKSPSMK